MTPIEQAICSALLQFLWQGALVALIFSLTLIALRKQPAQTRYLAGCAALAVLTALPIITAYLMYRPGGPAAGPPIPRTPADWMLRAWGAGVIVFSCRTIWNLVRIHMLRRTGTEPPATVTELASSVAKRIGSTRTFRVLISALTETPALIGWLRPVILLPAATVAGLTPEQLETVLAHEIAHIRRNDYLINILQVVAETLLFYHPAVWWISSRIRHERELCCDDEVVRFTGDPLGYARILTTLERLRSTPALVVGSAGGQLSYRIRRLVGQAQPSREIWPAILALMLTLVCVTISVRRAQGQQAQDTVTVEVTRDNQGAISGVRVLSGPGYLRGAAVQAAVQMPSPISTTIGIPKSPIPPGLSSARGRTQVLTFPAAFGALGNARGQQATVEMFVDDELAEAERRVKSIEGKLPVDQSALALARSKLTQMHYKHELVQQNEAFLLRPERAWRVQVLSHQLTEFRAKYQGKLLGNPDPALVAEYRQIQEQLAVAEKDLKQIGVR